MISKIIALRRNYCNGMKKVIVIGCPGSGKSTFSRALHDITGLPLIHLDMLYWNADKTTVDRPVFRARLSEAMQQSEWIIDGNYASTMELRMQVCDTIIFPDYPTEVCLEGVRNRRGKVRSDMPWIETEEDAEFMDLIRNFRQTQRPKVTELLEKYAHKQIFVFRTRQEADGFLVQMKETGV
jgi:adenylate kinase family enzyme